MSQTSPIPARAVLRYDDFCALSNTKVEQRLLEIVAEQGAKVVMAVVPFVADTEWELRGPIPLRPLSREKANLLKEFMPHHAEVALHGYSHQTVTRWSHLYEFGDRVQQKRQLDRLRDGRAFLEDLFGVNVQSFVPPWNEYSRSTLGALEEAGFRILSGQLGLGLSEGNLDFIPGCCAPDRFKSTVVTARTDPQAMVCLVLHEYDFKESGWAQASMDFGALAGLLEACGGQRVQWAGFEGCRASGEWSDRRLEANRELRRAMASPARRLLPRDVTGVYWSTAEAARKMKFLHAWNPRRWLSGRGMAAVGC